MSTTHPSNQPSDESENVETENRERWVTKRARFLVRANDLRQPVAESLAWLELGYSASGAAQRVGQSESTIKGYLDDLEDRFGYAVGESRTDLTIDLDLNDLPPRVSPVCPECDAEQVKSTAEAERILNNPTGDIRKAIDNDEATHVCFACGAHLAATPTEVNQ
jgi:hypothetical protein